MSKDTLIAEAILGRDVEEFLNTELGEYLMQRADAEIAEASEKLSTVAPWRRRKIQELQNQVWRAGSLKTWLAELIIAGRQSLSIMDDEE